MNTRTITRRYAAGLCATAGLYIGMTTAVAAPPPTVSGTYGTVVIGDLPGMLDRGAELGKSISPGISGDVIRGQLGMLLGDEGLQSIAPGSGLVLAIPTSGQPFLLLETTEGKAEDIANLIKQRLANATTQAVSNKLVAVAMDQAAMENASGAMGTAAADLLNGNDDKFIVVTIDADTLMKDKGPQLQRLLQRFTEGASASADQGSTGSAKAVSFVAHLAAAAAKRTDVATVKIDLSGEGVRLEKELWPSGGVNLQDPEGPTGQELLKSLPTAPDAMMRYEYYLDTQSAYEALKPMLQEAMNGAGVSSNDQQEMMKITDLAGESFGDGMGGWLGMNQDSARGVYLLSVTNQDQALQYLEQAAAGMSTGSLSQFYSDLGFETSATLTRNAQTIDGQPAHRFTMKMEGSGFLSKMPMANMQNVDSLITFVDNKMLMVFGDVEPEPVVTAVKSGSGAGTELQSRSQLPPDGVFYMDYDMGKMMSSMSQNDPQARQIAQTMEDVTLLEAGYVTDESVRFIMLLPGEAIKQMATGFQNMAQQGAGQSSPAGTVPRGSLSTGTVDTDRTTTDVEESINNVRDDVENTTTTP